MESSSGTINPGTAENEAEDLGLLLRKQLLIARNEIHNLRQQIRGLAKTHQQEVEKIHSALDVSHRCECLCSASRGPGQSHVSSGVGVSCPPPDGVSFSPIGSVSTWFPEKKATPRQPGVCIGSRGKLTLSNSVFTNPEHALEGLEGFSHMWILFHFHKNDSTHVRAKVSPPRLNGARTGVFGTRSPHRPSAIGLSLVAIDSIQGSTILFSGVDMVDGTPVLDIKPYIPQYDDPSLRTSPLDDNWLPVNDLRVMDGGAEEGNDSPVSGPVSAPLPRPPSNIGEREAPDGEEGARSLAAPLPGVCNPPPPAQVRVPAWITQSPVSKLTVTFSDRARAQLEALDRDSARSQLEAADQGSEVETAIRGVLQEDPRSVYLREKWGNQFFTFLIHNLHVSCKFDDTLHLATVFQVKPAGKVCECGQPEWQCTIHGDAG